jgi:hypothetical protein
VVVPDSQAASLSVGVEQQVAVSVSYVVPDALCIVNEEPDLALGYSAVVLRQGLHVRQEL